MKIKPDEEIKCKKCGKLFDDESKFCFPCRRKEVHEDTVKFISDLQKAQEATRKHSIHFGPGPIDPYGCNIDKPTKIKKITTTPEQMGEVIKNANIVVSNIPPWNSSNIKSIIKKYKSCDICGYDQTGTRVCPICYQRLLKELKEANLKLDKLKEVLYEDIPLKENLEDMWYECKNILNN